MKVKLEEVCYILDSQRIPITASDRSKGIYPYYGANGIQDYVDDYIFDDELVLLAEDGGNFGSTDKPIAYRVSGKCWVNNHAHVLKAKDCIDTDYLCYSLMFYNTDGLVNGATRQKLTQKAMRQMTIPLCNREKQQSIVATLKKVFLLIDCLNQLSCKLDELIKSRFVEMFGDCKSNPYCFEKKKLKDTCVIITGNTPSRAKADYYGDYIEWIKSDNIMTDRLYPTQAREYLSVKGMNVGRFVDKDSILMSCIAGSLSSIGRVCITDRKVAFNQQINALSPKEYNVFFLYVMLLLSKDYLVEEINMALKGILSKSGLGDKEYILPPIDLQKQFADFVTQVEQQKAIVQQSIDKLETLKKSLMQEYFG